MYLLDSRGSFYPFTDFHLTQNGSREVLNVELPLRLSKIAHMQGSAQNNLSGG